VPRGAAKRNRLSLDPADRLEGFVKVHQVAGLAVVRLASATTVAASELERLPNAQSIAIRRPARALAPDELLKARMEGQLSRHEAAWHRAKHFEGLSVDRLLTDWPSLWGDGEAAPFIARTLAPAGDRAVDVARAVLATPASGRTARVTAIRVLQSVGSPTAVAALKEVPPDQLALPLIRAQVRAALASLPSSRGWRSIFSFSDTAGSTQSLQAHLDKLTTAADKEERLSALEALELAGDDRAIPVVRQAWAFDAAQEVRTRAATVLGALGDSESVEALVAALRDRGGPAKEAKAALSALGELGDVRAVPDILLAVVENWGGPLPAEALWRIGIPALEPTVGLVLSRPELAQRKSLQDAVSRLTSAPETDRILSRRLGEVLDRPEGAEQAAALLKLASESQPLRASLSRQILARVSAPATKAEKSLVRAARQALQDATSVS
jgi:HEAT repeat protein